MAGRSPGWLEKEPCQPASAVCEFAIKTIANMEVITARKRHFISGLIIRRFCGIISVLSMED